MRHERAFNPKADGTHSFQLDGYVYQRAETGWVLDEDKTRASLEYIWEAAARALRRKELLWAMKSRLLSAAEMGEVQEVWGAGEYLIKEPGQAYKIDGSDWRPVFFDLLWQQFRFRVFAESAQPREAKALVALLRLQRSLNCWCDMAIGHPLVKEHSEACRQAQDAVAATAGEKS